MLDNTQASFEVLKFCLEKICKSGDELHIFHAMVAPDLFHKHNNTKSFKVKTKSNLSNNMHNISSVFKPFKSTISKEVQDHFTQLDHSDALDAHLDNILAEFETRKNQDLEHGQEKFHLEVFRYLECVDKKSLIARRAVNYIKRMQTDMVLIGKRKLTGMAKAMSVSVSDEIMHNCDCPVLVRCMESNPQLKENGQKGDEGAQMNQLYGQLKKEMNINNNNMAFPHRRTSNQVISNSDFDMNRPETSLGFSNNQHQFFNRRNTTMGNTHPNLNPGHGFRTTATRSAARLPVEQDLRNLCQGLTQEIRRNNPGRQGSLHPQMMEGRRESKSSQRMPRESQEFYQNRGFY